MRSSRTGGGYWDPGSEKIREIEWICRVDSKWVGQGRDYTDRRNGIEALRKALYADGTAFLAAA
jgi:hypothetical protein